jgi:hypothetical protein
MKYRIVPMEPTAGMQRAGGVRLYGWLNLPENDRAELAAHVYNDMLHRAPVVSFRDLLKDAVKELMPTFQKEGIQSIDEGDHGGLSEEEYVEVFLKIAAAIGIDIKS